MTKIKKEDKFKTNPFAKKYKAKLDAKKEVWGDELDKDLVKFKQTAIKNGNVSICMTTTNDKNVTSTFLLNHKGDSSVFVASFLKGMEKTCPVALQAGILKLLIGK